MAGSSQGSAGGRMRESRSDKAGSVALGIPAREVVGQFRITGAGPAIQGCRSRPLLFRIQKDGTHDRQFVRGKFDLIGARSVGGIDARHELNGCHPKRKHHALERIIVVRCTYQGNKVCRVQRPLIARVHPSPGSSPIGRRGKPVVPAGAEPLARRRCMQGSPFVPCQL